MFIFDMSVECGIGPVSPSTIRITANELLFDLILLPSMLHVLASPAALLLPFFFAHYKYFL